VILGALCLAGVALAREYVHVPSPADLYGELFTRVQMQSVFSDSKTFPDAVPLQSPGRILAAYARQRADPTFDLGRFVRASFTPPAQSADAYRSNPHGSVCAHIDALWSVLTRGPDVAVAYSSLLSLPQRYVVPGGRFREIYYWDSYFTMIGLEASGRHDLVRDMVHDFAFLIDRYGHVPNGSRSYYLSRSQPRGRGGLPRVSAAARSGVRILDAGRRDARSRRGARTRGAPAGRVLAQPLLG
jgi:alpha,alpha-trehalase